MPLVDAPCTPFAFHHAGKLSLNVRHGIRKVREIEVCRQRGPESERRKARIGLSFDECLIVDTNLDKSWISGLSNAVLQGTHHVQPVYHSDPSSTFH